MLALVAAALLNAAPFDPAVAFGRLPFIEDIEVSPGGERFAARFSNGGQSGLLIYELTDSGIDNRLVGESENLKVRRFFWKRDDRLVLSAAVPAERYGVPTVETRLLAITPAKPGIDPLFDTPVWTPRRARVDMPIQIQDDIVSVLPRDPKSILVQYSRPGENMMLHRVSVDHRARHQVVDAPKENRSFTTDVDGVVRARFGVDSGGRRLSLKMPDDTWKDFSHRVGENAPRFVVAGFPSDRSRAFVLSDHSTKTQALYVFNVQADEFEELLYSHPTSDVTGIFQRLTDGAAYGAVFAEENGRIFYFAENTVRDLTRLVENSLMTENVVFSGLNPQETMAVYWVGDVGSPGRYYIVDVEKLRLTKLPPLYPELEGVALGALISTSYEARDGLTIPAFVTLPPGITDLRSAQSLPFMLLPHGGPNARDYAAFDWLAQYLAHKGYGVLQMNFRGSTGYGAEFRDAGDRQWGQAMQDDITDGANWLVENGYADPTRLGIIGASYGGYAALMGAVKTPDLYTCAISINGVSSLSQVIDDESNYVGGEYRTRHIGRLWRDRSMLRENSPRFRADEISVPVLLIAGEDDRVVPDSHSTRMHTAIKRARGRSELVQLPEGSHYLDVGQNRITALRAIGEFMDQCDRS